VRNLLQHPQDRAICNSHDSKSAGPTAAKPDTQGPRLHRRQTFSRTKKNSDTHT